MVCVCASYSFFALLCFGVRVAMFVMGKLVWVGVIWGEFCRAAADGPVGKAGRSESAFDRGFCLEHTVTIFVIGIIYVIIA